MRSTPQPTTERVVQAPLLSKTPFFETPCLVLPYSNHKNERWCLPPLNRLTTESLNRLPLKQHHHHHHHRRSWRRVSLMTSLRWSSPSQYWRKNLLFPLLPMITMIMMMLLEESVRVVVHGETLAQRQAVYDFYVATNKSEGGWKSSCTYDGWLTIGSGPPSTFCDDASGKYSTFYGIICNAENGSIVELELFYCDLKGTLTASLSALTELQWLDLRSNQLSGTLPPQWSAMSSLTWIDMNVNQISGTLPPEWSVMTGLQYLNLNENQLSGTLPPQWSAMSGLMYLVLYSNQLPGCEQYGATPHQQQQPMELGE